MSATKLALDYEQAYVRERPRSRALYDEALAVFPSGVTHDNRFLEPFPVYVERAEGAYKWDVDGHRYIDYVMGHGALLLGHGHPEVRAAAAQQLERGTHPGASHELEVGWGKLVQQLVPSAELVRFVNSGTEATLVAFRLARAFTGRPHVLKFQGHFHGWHDYATVGVDLPYHLPTSAGVPDEVQRTMIVCPADLAAVERALLGGTVAAAILEPTGAAWGTYPVPPGFLDGLRELTQKHETLLIFDEVITGFRCAPGGVQEATGITPDLTALAKVLAGGLPGGAVAGRAEIIDLFSFRDDGGWNRGRRIAHPGTFNANPLSAAAGVAALSIVATGEPQRQVNGLAARLRQRLNEVAALHGLDGCVYGDYSMFHILPVPQLLDRNSDGRGRLREHRKLKDVRPDLAGKLRRAMLVFGVDLMGTGGMLSIAHTHDDVEQTAEAFDNALAALQSEGAL